MSGTSNNKYIPRWVDPKKFALHDVVVEGDIPAETMPRLAEVIIDHVSPVHARLEFAFDSSKRRVLTGRVSGLVNLKCQRCLGPVKQSIATDLNLAVVLNDEQAKNLPRTLEPWLIDRDAKEVDLHAVLEDELLLCVPMMAYHDEACLEPTLYSSGPDIEEKLSEKRNPFEVLGQLKIKK